MHLSEDYWVFELHQAGERRLLRELELRRRIDERNAEAARAAEPATADARSRRGIRRLLPRRMRPLAPTRPAVEPGTA